MFDTKGREGTDGAVGTGDPSGAAGRGGGGGYGTDAPAAPETPDADPVLSPTAPWQETPRARGRPDTERHMPPSAARALDIPRQRLRPLLDPRLLRRRADRPVRDRRPAPRPRESRVAARGNRRRRWLAFLVLATSAWMVATFVHLLAGDGLTLPEFLHIGVFALLALWLSQSFWTLAAGFLLLARARRRPPPPVAAVRGPRVALVMPIYNEDTERVFAGIAAIWKELAANPVFARCDFFVLSDTTSTDLWLREVDAWQRLRRRLPGGRRIFYRRRLDNRGRKTGNIEDFLTRWGGGYAYFLVLDADSLMSADTVAALVARMDADPALGLLQVPPKLVRGRTLFARMLQFAGELYGPLAAAGTAFWAMGSGNYWGHNAILRTRAFVAHCGLPELPGRPPLGGPILSHDFVEAALMRRAGYAVRIAWDLEGSYEEPPPTFEQFLRRDRRWCQGNLQHARILLARGLRPASRLHLLIGIMSYLTSPLWLLFLLLAVIRSWPLSPLAGAGDGSLWAPLGRLLPGSPESFALLLVTFLLLLGPKLFGLALAAGDRRRRRHLGGTRKLLAGFLLENLFAVLLAPATMLFHSLFVCSVLGGAAVDWCPQRRAVSRDTGAALRRLFTWPSLLGGTLLLLAVLVDPVLALWLSPVLSGLAMALPLATLTASESLGERLRRAGLLLVAEETAPPAVVRETDRAMHAARPQPAAEELFARTLLEPARLTLHLGLLAIAGETRRCDRARLRRLIGKAARFGPAALDHEERRLVLEMPSLLERLHDLLGRRPPDLAARRGGEEGGRGRREPAPLPVG